MDKCKYIDNQNKCTIEKCVYKEQDNTCNNPEWLVSLESCNKCSHWTKSGSCDLHGTSQMPFEWCFNLDVYIK